MFKIGAGFNPGFVNASVGKYSLNLPSCVSLLEFGPEEVSGFWPVLDTLIQERSLLASLHIARSPICEPQNVQELFIDRILNLIADKKFISVGFHLTGPRDSNIGKYGFSSYYDPTIKVYEERVVRFIRSAQSVFQKEIWLENTNFYSPKRQNSIEVWKSIDRICKETNAKVIVDLAHLLIDFWNSGLSPELAWSIIPWENVREIHLSGIVKSKDGSFHDGHSQSVHPEQWRILENIIPFLITDLSKVFVTIEHTEFDWVNRQDMYIADFHSAIQMQESITQKTDNHLNLCYEKKECYAEARLKKLLLMQLPKIRSFCLKNNINIDEIFNDWLKSAIIGSDTRLVFSDFEVEGELVIHSRRNFKQFFYNRQQLNAYRN
jgi:uncharacterized protein (UPF0276 family)